MDRGATDAPHRTVFNPLSLGFAVYLTSLGFALTRYAASEPITRLQRGWRNVAIVAWNLVALAALSRECVDLLGGPKGFDDLANEAQFGLSAIWTIYATALFSIGLARRHALLRWLGFAPLYDGLWVSPRDHADDVIGRLSDLGITTATAFRATALPAVTVAPADPDVDGATGMAGAISDIPARAWDLAGLRDRYQEFTAYASLLRDQTRAGEISTADALVARTRVMNEWRAFPAMGQDLPFSRHRRNPPAASTSDYGV